MLMECQADKEAGTIVCYVLEYSGKDSALVKYEMTQDYVGALKMMGRKHM
jgi:carbon monoxide dehydrogenase subunit G